MNTVERDVIILMYHHVADPPRGAPIRGLWVSPAQFAWQLDWLLARGVRFLTLRDLVRRAESGRAAPPQPEAILTFDDGYRDVYRNAFPLIRARGLGAVVFPVVGDLGRAGVVWEESADRTPAELLTEAEAREMAQAGIEFGSHLMAHRRADRLGAAELDDQLARSKAALERLLGGQVLSLAYPFGAYNEEVVAAAARAGFRCAVTTEDGANRDASLMRLRRISVKGARWYHRWSFRRALASRLAACAGGA